MTIFLKDDFFHRFLGLNHDIQRPINFAIHLFYTNYYTHSLGSYQNSATGVKWPNFGSRGSRDPDNTYHPQDCHTYLSPFYTACLRHIGIDPQTLFEEVGALSCLMELAGSLEILLLNWYRQRPHLLSRLTPHEFSNKMISHVYQVICEKLWNRPLDAMELDSIKQATSPLIEADFKIFQNNPDIIDSSTMPFRCRDFPLQNLVLSRTYIIHLSLATPHNAIPPYTPLAPSHPQPQKTTPSLYERCYNYNKQIETAIQSPHIHNVEHCLQILREENDLDIRFALEEALLDRLSSLKEHEAFIFASLQLMDKHAESIYYKALSCACIDILDYFDKYYQPHYPYPKNISNDIESLLRSLNPYHPKILAQ